MWQTKSPILGGNSKVRSYAENSKKSPILCGHLSFQCCPVLTLWQYAWLGSYACAIHLSSIVWFLHMRQFVQLLRLQHSSFQHCPVLTPAAICPALTPAAFIFPVLSGSNA
jgi:hypothetical protein